MATTNITSYIQSSSSNNGDYSLSVNIVLFPTHSGSNHLSPHEDLKHAESTIHSFVCSFIHLPTPASNIRACLVAVFEGLASNATTTSSSSINLQGTHFSAISYIAVEWGRVRAQSLVRPLSGITPLPWSEITTSTVRTCPAQPTFTCPLLSQQL